jgi:subtilisin family serine protease
VVRRAWPFWFFVSAVAFPLTARAQVDLPRALVEAARGTTDTVRLPRVLSNREDGLVSLLVERLDASRPWPSSATRLGGEWGALELGADQLPELYSAHPGFRFEWSPGRRLLMDRADGWVRASRVRADSGRSGAGVVVGIVDSGVDVAHADLRRADGSTRVRWLVDFSRPVLGRHPELEAELGCGSANECAVYSAEDIDELIANDVTGDEPRDTVGHGTHVASLAAGNGLSSSPARYVGVAPEAELMVAKVTATGSGISDADIVRAVRFLFDRADELGRPAALNLSLGSNFGAHDGSSALERALSELIGPEHPGRALVLAAGNSGGLYVDPDGAYPDPLGVHTELHLPEGDVARVPIVTPDLRSGAAGIDGWIEMRPGDSTSIAVELDGRTWLGPVGPGEAASDRRGELEITLQGQTDSPLSNPSARFLIRGTWPTSSRFAVRFEGHATLGLWLEGSGALDPSLSLGPLVPLAIKEGTVNVPASSPELIAVGATLNRSDWVDAAGTAISMPAHGALAEAPLDTTAYFSSAGPNTRGVMKPDLVAPGANLAGALSSYADPRTHDGGMFAADERCPDSEECFVVDGAHAIASGTSLAAPLVTGAIALLFETDPTLTQAEVRALLQAGARPTEGVVFSEQQVGIGALDVEGAVAAQSELVTPSEREPGRASWLTPAASFARPDPSWPLVFHAELRDDDGKIADGFDARRLALTVSNGAVAEPPTRLSPGLYRFSVTAPDGSGGETLRVALRFDGRVLLERELPIAVDPALARRPPSVRGGCAFSGAARAPSELGWLLALLGLWGRFRAAGRLNTPPTGSRASSSNCRCYCHSNAPQSLDWRSNFRRRSRWWRRCSTRRRCATSKALTVHRSDRTRSGR